VLRGTSKAHKQANIDPPATVDEIEAFSLWWRRTKSGANIPYSPNSLQTWFAKFRAAQHKPDERVYATGQTQAEVDAIAADIIAAHSHTDAAALAAFDEISGEAA
jgi:hypothetical protein